MTSSKPENVVFDCPVFAQALISPHGPAAACFTHAQMGRLTVFISEYLLQEIRELPQKLKPQLGVTSERINGLILDLAKYARLVDHIPQVYTHPIDPDDSHYVNLAIVTNSRLIVTRDRHLLNLTDESRAEAKEFKMRFPSLVIMPPDVLAQRLRTEE